MTLHNRLTHASHLRPHTDSQTCHSASLSLEVIKKELQEPPSVVVIAHLRNARSQVRL